MSDVIPIDKVIALNNKIAKLTNESVETLRQLNGSLAIKKVWPEAFAAGSVNTVWRTTKLEFGGPPRRNTTKGRKRKPEDYTVTLTTLVTLQLVVAK